ncbi:LOW QUALITY PROTEIN: uncharacterized protein ACR2FA_011716 [Aphomia sociella]
MYIVNESNLNKLLPLEQSSSTKLAESAAKVALYNFEWRYITLVIFNSTMINGVVFFSSYGKSQIIMKRLFYPSYAQLTRQFVLFVSDITEIMHILDWMTLHQFDNTGKYIIICGSNIHPNCDETEAAKFLWNHKIVNVVFLKRHSNDKEISGYAYYPFDKDCHSMRPGRLDILNTCLNINETKCSDIFPVKMTNLHKCPIIVSTFQQTSYMIIEDGKPKGADGDLLHLIADGINASLKIMTPLRGKDWGRLDEEGKWTGSLADVYDDFANFSMTSAALTLSRYSHFQISIDYYSSKIVWITHPAFMMPSSLKLLYPFQLSTQIAVVISFIFVVICAVMQNQCRNRLNPSIKLGEPQSSIIFYSWMICMGLPTPKLPRNWRTLGIALHWIWYCFFIRTLYQVCLIAVLQNNYYFPEFESIEDAYEAQYRFGGGGGLKDYYMDYPLVYNRWELINNSDLLPTLYKISEGLHFVLAVNMEIITTFIRKHNLQAHILPHRLISSPTVLFFKKFSPLVNPINGVLRQLIESGFAEKAYTDNTNLKVMPKSKDAYQPIHFHHYAGCYLILIIGWVSSTVLFIIELFWSKFHK